MTIRSRRPSNFRLQPEALESRDLLSGLGIAGFSHVAHNFFASSTIQQATAHALVAVSSSAVAAAHSQVFAALASHFSDSGETTLVAQLTDPNSSATGTIKYESETENGTSKTELKVSVTGATASSSLDVSIGGTVVGTLTTDSTGAGKLVLSSNPTGTEQSLPTNFPTSIAAGTAVSVGTLAGTLATPTSSTSGGCESHGSSLTAALTDANSSATGTVTYQSSTKSGTTTTTFTASVTGAAASSALDVAIGGTVVGQITTDSTGAGSLVLSSNPTGTQQSLPANFPTSISAGTAVTVGSLSGTFATSSNSASSSVFHHFGRHRG